MLSRVLVDHENMLRGKRAHVCQWRATVCVCVCVALLRDACARGDAPLVPLNPVPRPLRLFSGRPRPWASGPKRPADGGGGGRGRTASRRHPERPVRAAHGAAGEGPARDGDPGTLERWRPGGAQAARPQQGGEHVKIEYDLIYCVHIV